MTQEFALQLPLNDVPAELISTNLSHEDINKAIGHPEDTIITPKLTKFLDRYCRGSN